MRYALLLLISATGLQTQVATKPPFEDAILKFEADDAKNPPKAGGIVFIGSSSILGWRTLNEDFPDHNVINRGFGGSVISDSVRYAHRIVTPYNPEMVVFFAGSNDITAGKSAETVFADYKSFVVKVREKLPKTRIAFISISPAPSRAKFLEIDREANRMIREFCNQGENLAFIDIVPLMLDAKGAHRPELYTSDRLHMNPDGYKIWAKAVKPFLPWGTSRD
jgi:lysophospholipase L1-like esterase